MKNHTLVISALSILMLASLAPASFAQRGGAMSKAQAIAQQLNLTPQQKEKILPILVAEAPKVNAIKKELEEFVSAINHNTKTIVSELDGLMAMDVAHQILRKIGNNILVSG